MKEQLEALYNLQTLDVQIARINSALSGLNGARLLKQQLAAAKSKSEAAEKTLSSCETELKDSELKLKSIDEKRVRCEKRLYTATGNPKELSALEKEISMLKAQQGELDGCTLELYEVVESARAEAGAARKVVDDLEKQVAQALVNESDERLRLETELADMAPEREAAAAKVADKPLLARYEAVMKKIGATAVAKVVDGKCGGCHVSLTTFTVRRLYENKSYELCENCGRILFMEAE